MPETDDKNLTTSTNPSVEGVKSKGFPKRRSREFQHGLLLRLPRLPVPEWNSRNTLNVYQDLQSLTDPNADAFLGPLESLVGERHD
jgi:hypothetical protein